MMLAQGAVQDSPGSAILMYHGVVDTIRNYSAVTFACVMIRRAVYDELGG